MTRLYGRAPAGHRVHEATPQSHWKVVTLIGALRLSGMVAPMTVEAATDGQIFLAYVEYFLCPVLRPDDVVVMDNLSAHKVDGIAQLIETTGAKLLYLPPFTRSKPHREGLVQDQADPARHQGSFHRNPRPGHHGGSPSHHPRQCQSVVQALQVQSTVKGKML